MRVAAVLCLLLLSVLFVSFMFAHPAPPSLHYIQHQNTQVNIDPQANITVFPTQLEGQGETVTISWTGISNPNEYDFIALYSPIPTPETGGFARAVPVKYYNLTTVSSTGSISAFVLNVREDYTIVYAQGGVDNPVIVAQLATPLSFSSYILPMQVHLARTHDISQMRITWVAKEFSTPVIRYGFTPGNMTHLAYARADSYTPADLCGEPAQKKGWRTPGMILSAVLVNIAPAARYYYQIFDLDRTDIKGILHTFYSAPIPTPKLAADIILFGDMGQTEIDHFQNHEEQIASINTTLSIYSDILAKTIRKDAIIMHIGDISYARGYSVLWDQFFFQIQPIATQLAWMTCVGNHERDFPNSGCYLNGTDSGGECGVPYSKRLKMPRDAPDQLWYQLRHGPVSIILMSTEHNFNISSTQWMALETMLASVDRTQTPWLVFAGHRPMYINSNYSQWPDGDTPVAYNLRLHIEPLLQKYKCDLAFWGHHHSYQRTCAIFNGTCVTANEFGTVHVVSGAAGFDFSPLPPGPAPSWIQYQTNTVHGYVRLHAAGSKSLKLDFVSSHDRSIQDSITLSHQSDEHGNLVRPLVVENKAVLAKPPQSVAKSHRDLFQMVYPELQQRRAMLADDMISDE